MDTPRVDGRTARWSGHREQRRAAFVAAALAALERYGPGATVEQICAELGVTRQALYRQFDDRADLDRAIATEAAGQLVAHLLPHLGGGLSDVEGSVRRGIDAYLDYVLAHLALYRFVRAHDGEVDAPTAGSAVRQVKETVGTRIAEIARDQLVALDAASPELARTVATGLIGMADAVIGSWVDDPHGLPREQVVPQLVRMLSGAARAVAR